MKNKKIILYYLLEFILTIFIFLTIILIVMKITVLNKTYLKNILEKNNYYHELYVDINNDFNDYIMQSGFDNSITKDLFTESELKKVINNNVDNYFLGKDIIVETKTIKNKLLNNIDNYLKDIKITITDQESMNLFISKIESIYKERIILNKELIKFSSEFNKIMKLLNIIFIIILILDIVLFILIKISFKKITLTIPILSSMILLLICYYLLFGKININSIIFWNNYISKIIKNIFFDISNSLKYISIIGIILEIIKLTFIYKKNRRI